MDIAYRGVHFIYINYKLIIMYNHAYQCDVHVHSCISLESVWRIIRRGLGQTVAVAIVQAICYSQNRFASYLRGSLEI